MPRATTNKLYRTFVKGLVTEAGPLTFPENASIDEDNFVLFRKGGRARRYGLNYEPSYALSTYSVPNPATTAITEYTWDNPANHADLSFLVQQVGATLYFYRLDETGSAVSAGIQPFSLSLTSYAVAGTMDFPSYPVSMASGKGLLFVVGERMEPIHIEYNRATNTVTATRIYIQIRDFKGLDDGLANDEEPSLLSKEHEYNLMNQGWTEGGTASITRSSWAFSYFGLLIPQARTIPATTAATAYKTAHGVYPGNNKQWWTAKNGSGDFDAALLKKLYNGNNRAPRGHYVVDAFNIDRSAASGVDDLLVESTPDRPVSVTFFSGRVWYATNSSVYFSQVLQDKRQAGMCYQEADPTSEDITDLVATDGGVIPIPEMGNAIKLLPAGSGVLVFANNGVWAVSGTSMGFTAVDFSVAKINPIGAINAGSILDANGQVVWWSKVGIQGLSPKSGALASSDGGYERINISEQTIQSFYLDDIPEDSKKYVKCVYDSATNTIQWLFRSGNTPGNYFYDRILNLDMTLGSFYPWTISSTGSSPYITGVTTTLTLNTTENRSSALRYLTAVPDAGVWKFTFSYFNDTTFADWRTFNGTGFTYTSFIETGYELLEDAMRNKETLYVFVYLRRTEENFVETEDGDFVADKPSSCKFQIKWDWASSSASNKWSTKTEAYRHNRLPMPDETDLTFDTGFPVVVTKNKVRGNGRAIQFRFESSEIGKDCDLLGWAVPFAGNTQP